MRDEHATSIAAMGTAISPELVEASQRLYASHHAAAPPGIAITRDRMYGDDERHRLDVFTADARAAKPVLLFVHGGGFVRGDKALPGTPYYDNVGLWAATNGFVGVTMTYRLAPAHTYPAGAADIAAAVAWIRANIAAFGGDPEAIVLLGQSAGAAHAAMYAARPDLSPRGHIDVAGIGLMSGVYDFARFEPGRTLNGYLPDEPGLAERASSVDGLVAANVPVLLVISELDPPAFQRQAMLLGDALFARDGRFPNVVFMPRHNHISQIAHLGAQDIDDPVLASRLAEFIRTSTRAHAGAAAAH
jgi:triacylglycerol lipase